MSEIKIRHGAPDVRKSDADPDIMRFVEGRSLPPRSSSWHVISRSRAAASTFTAYAPSLHPYPVEVKNEAVVAQLGHG